MTNPFRRRSPMDASPVSKFVGWLVLLGWALIVLAPLYWLFVTSFKDSDTVGRGPFYIPFVDFQPTLDSWRDVLIEHASETIRPYLNTIVIGLISAFVAVLLGATSAYALVRFRYRPRMGVIGLLILCLAGLFLAIGLGVPWPVAAASALVVFLILLQTIGRRFRRTLANNDIAFWLISQRILPPIAVVLPLFVLYQQIGLLDTQFAIAVTYVAANLPIAVWLMRDYFASLPVELEESASVDGASIYRIFGSIVLPLAVPGLVATFLIVLVFGWNEYLIANILSSANAQTMPLLIVAQDATRGPQWWTMSVLVFLMIVPVVVMAILLERYISRGLLVGALKG
ncbi:MAG: carbohydrate ABC transporter permease [Candidatus Limnocylindrales bacterium]